MSDKERDSFLQSNGLPSEETWPEAATPTDLDTALAKIRTHSLAITHSKAHIIGLAVPIRKSNLVVASLSVFLPEIRCSASRQKEIIQALQQAAQVINERLDA